MVFANLVPETTTASKLIHERWKFLLNERIVGLNLSIAGGIESEKKKIVVLLRKSITKFLDVYMQYRCSFSDESFNLQTITILLCF